MSAPCADPPAGAAGSQRSGTQFGGPGEQQSNPRLGSQEGGYWVLGLGGLSRKGGGMARYRLCLGDFEDIFAIVGGRSKWFETRRSREKKRHGILGGCSHKPVLDCLRYVV